MLRMLFSKTGDAVWISHLDTMRLFQRTFKRSGMRLKHTQGFNPRPSVSIALPLSVGVESDCELLDFELDGQELSCEEIKDRLNASLLPGVHIHSVYSDGCKLKFLKYLRCAITLEYDKGIPDGAPKAIAELFTRDSLLLDKKGKNGITQQDIIPMIRSFCLSVADEHTLMIDTVICCQEPTLNPAQFSAAIVTYIPQYQPDFSKCKRLELFDAENNIFR